MGKTNTNFLELSQFMMETFKNITYIDYNNLILASKPMEYNSEIMQQLVTTDYNNMPYFELLQGLIEEVNHLNYKLDNLEDIQKERLVKYQKQIKKLLLIKEDFELKTEVGDLKNEMKVLESEIDRLKAVNKK